MDSLVDRGIRVHAAPDQADGVAIAGQARAPSGARRGVLEASADSHANDGSPVLALVLEVAGSTYAGAGAMALFSDRGQVGWLSGGCLEPRIAQLARRAADGSRIEWLEIDTREDEDLFGGAAVGCRGRLRLALVPLRHIADWPALVAAWSRGEGALRLAIDASGAFDARVAGLAVAERMDAASLPWTFATPACGWSFDLAPPPSLLVLGGGPESPTLLPLLRSLGWRTTLVERRERWRALGALADAAWTDAGGDGWLQDGRHDAALVMHHNFELDREALSGLAATSIAFVGLLGPARRREDLFRVLPAAVRDALAPRLHSPVGLPLGGHGPEAIALSIAAELHAHLHETT